MIDVHAHILVGVDDGPAGEPEAIALLEQFVADGVHTVVATPHALDGRYDVSAAAVREGIAHVNALAKGCRLPVVILPGHEVVVTPDLPERLRRGEVLCLGGESQVVLVEMGFQVVPPGLQGLVFQLGLDGYQVLLAHPERNLEVQKRPEALADIVAAGARLQLNAGSIAGHGGRRAAHTAAALVEKGWVAAVGSDAHHARHRPCFMGAARDQLERWFGGRVAEELLETGPARLLAPVLKSRRG